ncbi:MAG: hypothetical protein Q8O89_06615, partial [Nanoarchaeota archaeon]|nr:hypothetical protein [Nanoarchaeota archaeon]
MMPKIVSVELDYAVYNPGSVINFKYWISNPFANELPNTEIYAGIRPSGSSGSWSDYNTWPYSNIVTIASATNVETKRYDRTALLPITSSAGNYSNSRSAS